MSKTKGMALAALFAALTAVGTLFLKVPVGSMYITLQVFFTTMAGVVLGPKWGAVSQAVYVLLGIVGLPVFTNGGGIWYLVQPSFGFLLGLIPQAWVVGTLCQSEKCVPSIPRVIGASAVGVGVLYLIGLPYMYAILNVYMGKGVPVGTVVRTGMLIYLPFDAIKIALTAVLAKPLVRAVRRS
ncbi:MAG: biotin transporter BioY [Oscillospiraceae bacterium]|nr:biotin transporter BioY [Oscillospiraceae bacterium]